MNHTYNPRTTKPCACGSVQFKRYISDGPIYDECVECGRQFNVDAASLAEGQDFSRRWHIEVGGFTNSNI